MSLHEFFPFCGIAKCTCQHYGIHKLNTVLIDYLEQTFTTVGVKGMIYVYV